MHEIDVALTDFGLTLQATLFAALIARDSAIPKSPRSWLLVFWFSTAAAALFGGILHGFLPDEATLAHTVVWRLSLLSIGLTALSGWMLAVHAFLPAAFARWLVPVAGLQFVAYALVLLFVSDQFWIAIVDYLPPVLLLLALLAYRALAQASRPAALGALGFLLMLVAAAVQRLGIALHPSYFDHNALYHAVQAVALALVFFSLRDLLRTAPSPSATPHSVGILWMITIFAALQLATPDVGRAETADAPHPPNIVLIVADDLGWNDVGYHGSVISTPHIDALAKGGVRLRQFYANPLCTPTRASLMTGRHAFRLGIQGGILKPWSPHGLPLEERTLAEALGEAGYVTHLVGKWHLGMNEAAQLPLARGFDHHYGPYAGSVDYFEHTIWGGLDWHRDGKPLVEKGYATHLLGREAVRIIRAHAVPAKERKPLFLMLSFTAPHRPLQAPPEQLERYAKIARMERRSFAAMVSIMDEQIGNVLGALEDTGAGRDTLVLFVSDNGAAPLAGGSNGGLRGGKGTLYEGGIRVPAIAHWPGRLAAGNVVDRPLHVVDLHPTLLALAGYRGPMPTMLDGENVWASLTDEAPAPDRELLLYSWPAGGALRQGNWKLVVTRTARDPKARVELFHLGRDPRERSDLAAVETERVAAMRQRLDELTSGAVPAKRNPKKKPPGFPIPKVWGDFQ